MANITPALKQKALEVAQFSMTLHKKMEELEYMLDRQLPKLCKELDDVFSQETGITNHDATEVTPFYNLAELNGLGMYESFDSISSVLSHGIEEVPFKNADEKTVMVVLQNAIEELEQQDEDWYDGEE